LRGELAPSGVGVSIVYPGPIREAGMWADTGLAPPMGLRTRSPEEVGAGVIRAIESNRAAVMVAPLALRVGAVFGRCAPGAVVRLAPGLGAYELREAMAAALRHKRYPTLRVPHCWMTASGPFAPLPGPPQRVALADPL